MADDTTPRELLIRLMNGYWHTQAIYVAAKLGLADLVQHGSKSAEELAAATHTDPRALYRLLRALASLGIFAESEGGRFTLTPMAACLAEGSRSVRSLAIVRGEWQYEAWSHLLYSVQTGKSAFEKVYGQPLFDFLGKNPDKGRLFDAAMTGVHGPETQALLEAYDFSSIGILADIGGGNGEVISSILKQYPLMRGILFDMPSVAQRTRAILQAAGFEHRCEVRAGNFFEEVPAGADAYLLRHIIHDWDDRQSIAILRNCKKAMGPKGKLLVVEGIIPPGNEPSLSKFFDLAMMVLPGGMERTLEEYRQLFEASGFRITEVAPTSTWISVIEGEPM